MFRKKSIKTFIILLVIMSMLANTLGFVNAKPQDGDKTSTTKYGIIYFSTHNHYEPQYLTDQVLNRDFKLFKEQGFRYVTLPIIWKYFEPTKGSYNEDALDDIERVCNFAAKYKLKIIIEFYTMMQEDTFTMPTWLSPRKFEQVFLDPTIKQAWLNFQDHCARRLNNIENIYSWHMMNEPARKEWACDVSIEDFLELWTGMKTIFKSYSDRPVSIRFAAQVLDNPEHFNRDPRIYNLLDYVSLNWYEDHCSKEILESLVNQIKTYTKVTISEFGFSTDDDQLQEQKYQEYISLFKRIKINECTAWMWRADYDSPNPEPAGTGFNLAKNIQGKPRPAFYLLTNTKPNN